MTHRVLIRYRGPQHPLQWLAEDERGRSGPIGDGERIEPRTLAAAGEIVVIVAIEHTLLLEAEVAARSREQLLRAIPFAVEDQLAEPVEGLHFSAIPHPRGSGQLVLAVRRERLREWLADLSSRGIRPDRMLVDALLLPLPQGSIIALIEGDCVLVRSGAARAFAASIDELPEWLVLADAARDADGRSRVRFAGGSAPALDAARFTVEREPGPGEALAVLAAGLRAQSASPDLLVGEFAPRHRGEPLRKLWRLAAVFAVAAIVAGFGWVLLDRHLLGQRVAALRGEIGSLYSQIYPGSPVQANAIDRVRADYRVLGGRNGEGGALELLAQVAPLVSSSPQTFIKGVEYRSGALELVLLTPGVASLDQLRESIDTLPGLSAELAGATAREGGTEGRLRIGRRQP
jgi:general secretion pathway protein L